MIDMLTNELNNFLKEKAEDRGVNSGVVVLLEKEEVEKTMLKMIWDGVKNDGN